MFCCKVLISAPQRWASFSCTHNSSFKGLVAGCTKRFQWFQQNQWLFWLRQFGRTAWRSCNQENQYCCRHQTLPSISIGNVALSIYICCLDFRQLTESINATPAMPANAIMEVVCLKCSCVHYDTITCTQSIKGMLPPISNYIEWVQGSWLSTQCV